jgi:hypothetical protein
MEYTYPSECSFTRLSRDNHSDNGVSRFQSSSQIDLDAYILQSFYTRLEKLPAASDMANSECGNRRLLALPILVRL